jgi:hypothetical protein
LPLYVAERWRLKKEQIRRTKTEEMRFLRAVFGHRMMDRKGNEDIKEELGIKETRKETNEKYHMEELDLLKRIPGSCFNSVNRKAREVTGVRPISLLR